MAVALDASTPVRWTGAINADLSITSASFTAPADALLAITCEYDGADAASVGTINASDSGGLTWSRQVERTADETTAGGGSVIFTARTVSSVARTVNIDRVGGTQAGLRISAVCRVWTGVDVDGTPVDTVGAGNEGGSTTNSISTTSITPGATGVLLVADCDWQALGAFEASSDLTQDTTTYAGAISVCDGYKTCTSGVGVTGNLNAAGAGAAQHKWCQIVIRESGGAAAAPRVYRLTTLGVGQ